MTNTTAAISPERISEICEALNRSAEEANAAFEAGTDCGRDVWNDVIFGLPEYDGPATEAAFSVTEDAFLLLDGQELRNMPCDGGWQ